MRPIKFSPQSATSSNVSQVNSRDGFELGDVKPAKSKKLPVAVDYADFRDSVVLSKVGRGKSLNSSTKIDLGIRIFFVKCKQEEAIPHQEKKLKIGLMNKSTI